MIPTYGLSIQAQDDTMNITSAPSTFHRQAVLLLAISLGVLIASVLALADLQAIWAVISNDPWSAALAMTIVAVVTLKAIWK